VNFQETSFLGNAKKKIVLIILSLGKPYKKNYTITKGYVFWICKKKKERKVAISYE
jgi:hypothetical protein